MSELAKPMMTAQDARTCIDSINSNLRNTRELLLDLYEREGWRALGYDSWEKCAVSEFTAKRSYLFYELSAAKTEKAMIESQSTIVDKVGTLPESHNRPLSKVEPARRAEVYEKAIRTAPGGTVTARHVQETVERAGCPVLRDRHGGSHYHPLNDCFSQRDARGRARMRLWEKRQGPPESGPWSMPAFHTSIR